MSASYPVEATLHLCRTLQGCKGVHAGYPASSTCAAPGELELSVLFDIAPKAGADAMATCYCATVCALQHPREDDKAQGQGQVQPS
jgi:hypothetical protein